MHRIGLTAAVAPLRGALFQGLVVRSALTAPLTPSRSFVSVAQPAASVFAAAQKDSNKEAVTRVAENLDQFAAAYLQFPKLRQVALNPLLTTQQRKSKYGELFKKLNYHPVSVEILQFFLCTNKSNKLGDLAKEYGKLLAAHRNEVKCIITSALKLSDAQVGRVRTNLQSRLGAGQKMTLETVVDPALMGGLVVRMGSKALDLSVSSQIKSIDRAIKK